MNTVSEADHPSLQSAQVVAQRLGVDPKVRKESKEKDAAKEKEVKAPAEKK